MAVVARVSEISVTSEVGFQDAVEVGLRRAGRTLRHIRSADVKSQRVVVHESGSWGYEVTMLVSFVLDEGEEPFIDPAFGQVGVH